MICAYKKTNKKHQNKQTTCGYLPPVIELCSSVIKLFTERSSSMASTATSTNQIAVCLEDCILVLSKQVTKVIYKATDHPSRIISTDYTISICNLWTEQWSKHIIPNQLELPEVEGQTGVAIRTDVYIFGSTENSNLWKLRRSRNGSFEWSIIHIADQAKVPSPRVFHCAWEHSGKMWVFGGKGPSPVDYLNDHGDFVSPLPHFRVPGSNNQLFFFYLTTRTWTNVKCSGDVPSPRYCASTANIQDNVWLYGGLAVNNGINDLYELCMRSLVWTKIETAMPRPSDNRAATLTPISASQLVLYGGVHQDFFKKLTGPWIFDTQSHTWRQHPPVENCNRHNHTGITGLDSVIILGGSMRKPVSLRGAEYQVETTVYVRLEPKCLQQLAIQMIYKHRSNLPWQSLHKNLTCIIMDHE